MAIFGEAVARLRTQGLAFELILPTMAHLVEAVRSGAASWPIPPKIVVGETEKRAAFRIARAALAKSGTVTLELALSGVPMVAAYKAGRAEAFVVLRAIKVSSVILANLVIGDNVVPEFIQNDCTPQNLARGLGDLLSDTPQRQRQLDAFKKIDAIMSVGKGPPSIRAAEIVLATMRKGTRGG
jgi:lipid-A-disaccharide synthase